jgi:hypothetical protein
MKLLLTLTIITLLAASLVGQTLSGQVTKSSSVQTSNSARTSYIGNSDPGLLITAVSLGTLRNNWQPFFPGNGYGGFGFWSLSTPKTIKALCRRKNAGNHQVHHIYIIDDIDPCGNIQCSVDVDLSIGNEGDWICADLPTPWTPPLTGTPYNILSSEDNNGDSWYWDNSQATSIHGEWIYPGHITWSTYANPACTTSAGNADNGGGGYNYLYGPVNMIIANP